MTIDFERLRAPFAAEDVRWRIGQCGLTNGKPWAKAFAYLDARAVTERLDEVCGPLGWQRTTRYVGIPPAQDRDGNPVARDGFICAVSIRDPETGEWIVREDGAGLSDIEPLKGGCSDSFKRAAAAFGVGAIYYRLEETWAECSPQKAAYPNYGSGYDKKSKQRFEFSWKPPELPAWALPGGSAPAQSPPEAQEGAQKPARRARKGAEPTIITDSQLRKLGALRGDLGLGDEEYHRGVRRHYGVESTKDLTREQASSLIERLELRLKARLDDEAGEAFGDGRLGKLRAQALGYCAAIGRQGCRYVSGKPVDFLVMGFDGNLEELREMIGASGDEGELEGLIVKLEKLLEEMAF